MGKMGPMGNKRMKVKAALGSGEAVEQVEIHGWVRTRRDSKDFSFIEINDGSCLANLQVVVDAGIAGHEHIHNRISGTERGSTGGEPWQGTELGGKGEQD